MGVSNSFLYEKRTGFFKTERSAEFRTMEQFGILAEKKLLIEQDFT